MQTNYQMNRFSFIKALWSPFKSFKLKFYLGKTAIGTPYFFPRKWVKNPDKEGYLMAIPKKVGFDFVSLGWKTKWSETDYRFEWAPLFSFVFFGYQLAIMVYTEHQDQYWEAWLYYENNTDKTKSQRERIKQCRKEFPLTYIQNSTNEKIDYYEFILKNK